MNMNSVSEINTHTVILNEVKDLDLSCCSKILRLFVPQDDIARILLEFIDAFMF
jgi:hypothetical protein